VARANRAERHSAAMWSLVASISLIDERAKRQRNLRRCAYDCVVFVIVVCVGSLLTQALRDAGSTLPRAFAVPEQHSGAKKSHTTPQPSSSSNNDFQNNNNSEQVVRSEAGSSGAASVQIKAPRMRIGDATPLTVANNNDDDDDDDDDSDDASSSQDDDDALPATVLQLDDDEQDELDSASSSEEGLVVEETLQ
jgi:hypothetical protein